MECRECPFWQGTKCSEWGDCYRIISVLQPALLELERYEIPDDEDSCKIKFNVPFDPHDIQYWRHLMEFQQLYYEAVFKLPISGIHTEKINGLYYIQTHKNYTCKGD